MQSSPFQSDHGSLLDFEHTGVPIYGDPDYPFEAALRLGVPISERGLLMGTEQYKPGPQSALLRAKVQPSGMYTVRTSSLPVMEEAERQSVGILPQTSRMMGALSRPPPVLVEPKAGIGAELDGTFRQPYMNVKEAKRDETTGRAFGTVQDQTREVRQGLAEMGARYGTSMAPPASIYGFPEPGNAPRPKKKSKGMTSHHENLAAAMSAPSQRHVTSKGIITHPGPPVPLNAATMATMQSGAKQGTFGTWARSPAELAQGYHQPVETENLYGGYRVDAAYPAGAVQNSMTYGASGTTPTPYSAAAPPGPTISTTLADPLAIYRSQVAAEAAAREGLKKKSMDPTRRPRVRGGMVQGQPCIPSL